MPSPLRRPPAGPFRWLLFAGLLLAVFAADRLPAQAPPKGKAPPSKEEEDPAAKPVKPPPRLDEDPKPPPAAPADGPGVPPPTGVLVVGVRSLPELMSPRYARTDSEKFALDLLFEGLVRPAMDGAAGRVHEPALARELPALVPLGRAFTLTDATWADPDQPNAREPVTAADVRSTVDKLQARRGQPGAEAGELIKTVYTDAPQRCRVVLARGHIDPLSVMAFKVLPNAHKDDETFARKPVGSGPFVYGGRVTKGGREYALFPANPAYRERPDRPNLPRLSAVWMVVSHNPVADVRGGLVHFALTSDTGGLAGAKPAGANPVAPKPAGDEPRQAGKLEVIMGSAGTVDTLFSRRIHFLAVNHQVPALGEKGRDLRRLIAFAIQRDAILTACFRAGYADFHRPLDGPFPRDTWPYNPAAGRLDDQYLARALAAGRQAKVELELKYPDGDPAVARACKLIAEQVADLKCGVTLKPKAVEAADYHKRVFLERDFQLAYWHYDYPDEWFSPAGLFDPSAQDFQQRNFMRYDPPAEFQQLLLRCQDRREFGEVRRAMQQLHAAFVAEMPFIPLWHLDTHALLATGLTTVPPAAQLDPLSPFTHVEQWSVK